MGNNCLMKVNKNLEKIKIYIYVCCSGNKENNIKIYRIIIMFRTQRYIFLLKSRTMHITSLYTSSGSGNRRYVIHALVNFNFIFLVILATEGTYIHKMK